MTEETLVFETENLGSRPNSGSDYIELGQSFPLCEADFLSKVKGVRSTISQTFHSLTMWTVCTVKYLHTTQNVTY